MRIGIADWRKCWMGCLWLGHIQLPTSPEYGQLIGQEEAGMSISEIHHRFVAQASWTASIRRRIFSELHIRSSDCILEVGCGTGAITAETATLHSGQTIGIDIASSMLAFAKEQDPNSNYACADGFHLPFPRDTFQVVYCHFLLLWLTDPVRALREMQRVCRSGGVVLALAEPDYAARIDFPKALEPLGCMQRKALLAEGADPDIGRQLRALFRRAGFERVRVGLLGGEWMDNLHPDWLKSEHETLKRDLRAHIDPSELKRLLSLDERAWQEGERILFVPTFHAMGKS